MESRPDAKSATMQPVNGESLDPLLAEYARRRRDEAALGAGDGRIEPAKVIGCQLTHVALALDEHMVPLTALSFMTGDRVSKLQSQGIEVRVRLQRMFEL